ncbi:hypothetical protein ACFLX3_02205 [Chloroflexota bacterium]
MNVPILDDESTQADFCIEISYKKESENPSRVFRSLFELIDTFQEIDRNLVTSIDVNIEPVLLLEDIEVGSIKVWLSNKLKLIPDDSAYHMDWKPIVGQYLLRAKWAMINFLEGKTTISNANEIDPLGDEIHELAEKTEVRWLPDYTPLPHRQLLEGMQRISQSLSYLSSEDKAKYLIPNEPEKEFNLTFNIAPENIEDLLAKEILTAENEMILKVKKPDYLGDSMWDMRHGKSIIQVTVLDKEWLNKFQDRQIDIRPGDSIRAKVQIDNKYDFNGELISTHFNVSKILEVMHMPNHEQPDLFSEAGDEQ